MSHALPLPRRRDARVLADRDRLSPTTSEWGAVAAVLAVLELVTYGSYFLGVTVPNGDVNAHYLSDAQDWWSRGGMVSPPDWVSYAWMGRPAGSNLQDGSYVLPQGLTHLVLGWTPTSAAVMSALVVAFGALGMYVLVRRFGWGHAPALLGLVGQFFAPSLFANAQWLDFHRGAALLPWLLLVASPLWPWGRRWALPAAAVLVWQVLVGVYPGQIVAGAYCAGAWLLVWILASGRDRAWAWMWRAAVAAGLGAALAAVKLVPALLGGSGQRVWEVQRAVVDLPLLATLFFPYDNPAMGSDIALRPFFLVAPVLLLACMAPWAASRVRPVLALGVAAAAGLVVAHLGPAVQDALPGLDLSRVLVNDFRIYLMAAGILTGAAGFRRLLDGGLSPRRVRLTGVGVLVAALALGLTLQWGGWGVRGLAASAASLAVLVAAGLVADRIARASFTPAHTPGAEPTAAPLRNTQALLALAAASGLIFAYGVTSTWASGRVGVETAHYGAQVSDLADRGSACDTVQERRPSRSVPAVPPEDYWHDTASLAGAFTCELSIGGYVNIPGHPVLRDQAEAFVNDGKDGDLHRVVSAPGAVFPYDPSDGQSSLAVSDQCLLDGRCDGMTVAPVSFDPDGTISYRIEAQRPMTVALNESFYPGWSATACPVDGSACTALPVRSGVAHLMVTEVPQGASVITVDYAVPHRPALRILFGVALVLTMATAFLPRVSRTALWGSSNARA